MRTIFKTGILINRNFPYLLRAFFQGEKMCHNSTVFVRQFEKEDTMKITFTYKHSDFPIQDFTFMRSKSELLEAALTRIKGKIQAAILKRTTRKKKKLMVDVDQVLPHLDIVLMKNGIKVEESTENINAWAPDTQMKINNESYRISVNPPTVEQISLPKCILSGFPVYPKIMLEFCSREDSIFKWYQSIPKHNLDTTINKESMVTIKNEHWNLISQGFIYIPQQSDEGHKLRVSCIPHLKERSGTEEAVVSVNSVLPSPGKCPFEDRHKFTKESTKPESLRLVSYNILADLYADTDTARNALFPYCPAEVLALDYRKPLYLREIMGYNADIVCLQEVDRSVFHDDLIPVLSSVGLKGVFNEKGGQVAEGLSCFYRDSKFKFIESHSIILSEAIRSEQVLQDLFLKISENDKLLERFSSRTTALQVTLLESQDMPHKRILVGNTHLYFHPRSDNIRLLQGTCCLLYLQQILQKYQEEDSSHSITLIFSGDFNSTPDCGVYKLATEGFLPSSCIDWKSNCEEIVEGINLSLQLKLSSACGTPEYTNFTEGFVGCLDYIYYDKSSLEVTEVVPMPSHEQVTQHTALPSKIFPSDHIALVSTLKWK